MKFQVGEPTNIQTSRFIYSAMKMVMLCIIFSFSIHLADASDIAASYEPERPWLEKVAIYNELCRRIKVPEGYRRVDYPKGTYSDWIRRFPLKKENSSVIKHGIFEMINSEEVAGVLDLDQLVIDRAKSSGTAIRLFAEYQYQAGLFDDIVFSVRSGHKISYRDWASGLRPMNKGRWTHQQKMADLDCTYPSFLGYVDMLNLLSNSSTLKADTEKVTYEPFIEPGDMLVHTADPGHVIMIMDVAESVDSAGEKENSDRIYLLANAPQSGADAYIMKNPYNRFISPWYHLKTEEEIKTQWWMFPPGCIRGWK